MARQRYTRGKSTAQLIKIKNDIFFTMSKSEQREIVSKLASTANKRLRALSKAGATTSATIRAELSGGKFSIRGKTDVGLTNEFVRVKRFLASSQSTVTGWKKEQKRLSESLKSMGIEDNENRRMAYAIYDVIHDYNPDLQVERAKYELVDKIEDMLKDDLDIQAIYDRSTDWLRNQYDELQSEYNALDDYETDTPVRYKRRKRR